MILNRAKSYLLSELKASRKEISFLIFASFLISFLLTRLFIVFFEGKEFWAFGYHIHHFFYGIILMAIAGWFSLNFSGEHIPRIGGILYGCGLGLIADEAGLLLTFGDYWNSVTYVVVLIISLLFLIVIYFTNFWKAIGKNALSIIREPSGLDLPIVRRSDGTLEPFQKSRIVRDLVISGKSNALALKIMNQVVERVQDQYEITPKQIASEVKNELKKK